MGLISLILLAILAVPTLQEKSYSSGPGGMLWDYDVCPMVSNLKGSLGECKYICSLYDACTAFNFVSAGANTRCELLKCPVPIPKPTWNYGRGWLGYYQDQVTEQGECDCVKKELETIKEHLEQGDSQRETMQEELGRIKELIHSMSDSISSLSKNISYLIQTHMPPDCSKIEDGFESGGKCYKLLTQYTTWYQAKRMCDGKGMKMAEKPSDPIGLRKHIVDNFDPHGTGVVNVWLDAKGDGSGDRYRWGHDSTSLKFRDSLWYTDQPANEEERGKKGCLHLIGYRYDMGREPNSPYGAAPCLNSINLYALCEPGLQKFEETNKKDEFEEFI